MCIRDSPSTDYVRFLERKLSEVYRAGIVSTEELNQLHKDSTTAIMAVSYTHLFTRLLNYIYKNIAQTINQRIDALRDVYKRQPLACTLWPKNTPGER